ncbi:MAG TPA: adenylate/guanylate cyclase domain-containing protein [Beijerinckiaceae bacterium]|jgi:class 3 adenylate cyclase
MLTASSPGPSGLDIFLERFCPEPGLLLPILSSPPRVRTLQEGDFLCQQGDTADGFWIVQQGTIAIRMNSRIVHRHAGDVIGEAAFYRSPKSHTLPTRGADMEAITRAKVIEIDASTIQSLKMEERACWHQTVANALTAKLDEATAQRDLMLQETQSIDRIIRRLVSEDAVHATAALAVYDSEEIAPAATGAILWFSDLAGFSSYAKALDPLETGAALRRFMDIQVDEISRAGGHVDKFMGDGLMAFWRAPDERRLVEGANAATTAALNAARRIVELAEELKVDLDIRIGLHVGNAVIGNFGGSDRIAFTLIGETVNSASRYEQARASVDGLPLGRVRVSEEAFTLLSNDNVKAQFEAAPRQFEAKGGRTYTVRSSTF